MPYKDLGKQRQYQNDWVKRRRNDWIARNGPCTRCGSTEDLEVDHIDPSTKVTHRVWTWSKEKREKELEKCQVLCHDCHVKKDLRVKPRGEDNGKSKFNTETVLTIRRLYAEGLRQSDIARRFNVSKQYVHEVVHRKIWKHLQE